MTLESVVKTMPGVNGGHSLLDLASYLRSQRIPVEGTKISLEQLDDSNLPCVASLVNPDHFIVVLKKDADSFHLINFNAQRAVVPSRILNERWGGAILTTGERTPPAVAVAVPAIQLDSLMHDIGWVSGLGKPVRTEYVVRNTGGELLKISEVMKTCKCINASLGSDTLEAGQSTKLSLEYSPDSRSGIFEQSVFLTTNDPENPTIQIVTTGVVADGLRAQPRAIKLSTGQVTERSSDEYIFLEHPRHFEQFDILSISTSDTRIAAEEVQWNGSLNSEWAQRLTRTMDVSDDVDFSSRKFRVIRVHETHHIMNSESFRGDVNITTNVPHFEQIEIPVFVHANAAKVFPPMILFKDTGENKSEKICADFRIAGNVTSCSVAGIEGDSSIPQTFVLEAKPETHPGIVEYCLSASVNDVSGLNGKKLLLQMEFQNGTQQVWLPIFCGN